jgi:hypothetical protein
MPGAIWFLHLRYNRESCTCNGGENSAFSVHYTQSVAKNATIMAHFALAKKVGWLHMKLAFQASSPKTFRPGWQRPGFFSVNVIGWRHRRAGRPRRRSA